MKKLLLKLSFKRKEFYIGIVMAIISLLSLCLSDSIKEAMIFVLVAFAWLFSGAIVIIDHNLNPKTISALYVIWTIFSAIITLFSSQLIMCSSYFFSFLGVKKIILGVCLCLIVYLLCFAITLAPRYSITIGTFLLIGLTTVNYFVVAFRGNELFPADILAAKTAVNVLGNYKLYVTTPLMCGWLVSTLMLFWTHQLPKVRMKKKQLITRLISFIVLIVMTVVIAFQLEPMSIYRYRSDGSLHNGYFINFALGLRELTVDEPEGYSLDIVGDLEKKISVENDAQESDNQPDIIVIMDEAFADLNVLGTEIQTNTEVTPFINSLSDNTIKGYALASVFGGATPNSEYEFLTGNTLLFLPDNTIPYQQYIKQSTYSMVSELESRGYATIAMHPFDASGWMRPTVYEHLGFDYTYFLENFPQENLLRDYVSDQEMFEVLIEKYERMKDEEQSVFLYGITMQNHGSYIYTGSNYKQTISLEGYSQEYSDVEQYLSLLYETDKAVEYLINYFSQNENDVVLLFYGDHLPKLNEDFYEEIHGGAFDDLDAQMLRYQVPFFIWTNYDSEEVTGEQTSLNYLSNYVYEVAGMELPSYNRFLKYIQESIPAINAYGYYSKEEERYIARDSFVVEEKLKWYSYLIYNAQFDIEGKSEKFFPVSADN